MENYLLNKGDLFLLFLNVVSIIVCVYIILHNFFLIKLNGIILRTLQFVMIVYIVLFFLWALFEFLIQNPPVRIVRLVYFDIPNVLVILLSVYSISLLGSTKERKENEVEMK